MSTDREKPLYISHPRPAPPGSATRPVSGSLLAHAAWQAMPSEIAAAARRNTFNYDFPKRAFASFMQLAFASPANLSHFSFATA